MGAREPRTVRDALVAELLGDIDTLLKRAETLPDRIEQAEGRLQAAAAALEQAAIRYGAAVNAFTGQAREQLTEHLQSQARQLASQLEALQAAGHHSTAQTPAGHSPSGTDLSRPPAHAGQRTTAALLSGVLEHGVTAVLASMLTAALVLVVIR